MMGCDIHCHVEVKVGDTWHHWSAPRVSRDYELFGRMAGVRDRSQKPIAKERGLPPDLSLLTSLAWGIDEPDAHSESWMSGAELEALLDEWDEKRNYSGAPRRALGYLFGNGFLKTDDDESWPDEVTDVRVVFWFDN